MLSLQRCSRQLWRFRSEFREHDPTNWSVHLFFLVPVRCAGNQNKANVRLKPSFLLLLFKKCESVCTEINKPMLGKLHKGAGWSAGGLACDG